MAERFQICGLVVAVLLVSRSASALTADLFLPDDFTTPCSMDPVNPVSRGNWDYAEGLEVPVPGGVLTMDDDYAVGYAYISCTDPGNAALVHLKFVAEEVDVSSAGKAVRSIALRATCNTRILSGIVCIFYDYTDGLTKARLNIVHKTATETFVSSPKPPFVINDEDVFELTLSTDGMGAKLQFCGGAVDENVSLTTFAEELFTSCRIELRGNPRMDARPAIGRVYATVFDVAE